MNELDRRKAPRLGTSLHWLSSLQFNFAGFFIAIGVFTHAASVVGLAAVVYNSAAIDALLAKGLIAAPSFRMRARLETFYSTGFLVPVLGVAWCIVEQVRSGTIPPSAWIISAGVCALAVTITDGLVLARFRTNGVSPLSAAMPVLQETASYPLLAILGGALAAAIQSPWPDFVVAVAILYFHRNAPALFRQIGALDLLDRNLRDAAVFQLKLKYPRLGILGTSAWRESADAVRKRSTL